MTLGFSISCVAVSREEPGEEWETSLPLTDFSWKLIAEPIMKVYTETTDGSTIEAKESALVWHYQYADPDFGSCQAKELLDHLESVLANEPVSVKSGHHLVEVKPQVRRFGRLSTATSPTYALFCPNRLGFCSRA